jgi:hypothetical protein
MTPEQFHALASVVCAVTIPPSVAYAVGAFFRYLRGVDL